MRIVVTGANGRLGRIVVTHLLQQGFAVVGVDQQGTRFSDAPMITVDLCDLGQVFGALARADAVVHLGAIPAPTGRPPELVYRNNIMGQFNVFEAAAQLGIERVVSASSVSALGFPYQHRWSEPLYLPIDEQHPLIPQDAYGLSKANGEDIAAAYCRRTGGSAASLRISTVVNDEAAISRILAHVRRDPGASAHMLWSYVDVRDVAQACQLALTAPFKGHHPFYITSNDTTSELPTDELLERWFPTVSRRPGNRPPRWSLLDGARAAEMLGYNPQYQWTEKLAVSDAVEP